MPEPIAEIVGPLEFDPALLKTKYDLERDKRIQPEGNSQHVSTVDGNFADFAKDPADLNFARRTDRRTHRGHQAADLAGLLCRRAAQGSRVHRCPDHRGSRRLRRHPLESLSRRHVRRRGACPSAAARRTACASAASASATITAYTKSLFSDRDHRRLLERGGVPVDRADRPR